MSRTLSVKLKRDLKSLRPGSIWMISDSKFNDACGEKESFAQSSEAREPPKVSRTTLVEILSRREKLDMEFREDAHSPEWSGREPEDDGFNT